MKLFYESQIGRSMIEMLGVLAIVGILSVSGIAGYSKAMVKYKINKSIDDYAFFVNGIVQHSQTIFKTHQYQIAPVLNALGIIPDGWYFNGGTTIFDRDKRPVYPYLPSTLNIEFTLKKASSPLTNENLLFCQRIWTNIILPYSDEIYRAYLFSGNAASSTIMYYYGNKFCDKNKPCISSLILSDITSICSQCRDEENKRCVLNFTFK